MDLPVIDLTYLPSKFRRMFVSCQNIIKMAYLIDGDRIDRIPLQMRMDYINIFHMHFGMLSERHSDSEELKSSKTRFNLFDSNVKQPANIKEKAGLMSELAQICMVVIGNSLRIIRSNPKFLKVNAELRNIHNESERDFERNVLLAYQVALSYAKYSDESLLEIISPYLIRMQLDPIKLTGIKIPLVGTNDLNIKYLLGRFEEVFENVKILDYRLDYTSGYIDPDDSNDYISEFNNKYIEIGKSFLTYPMVFQKPDEMEVKI